MHYSPEEYNAILKANSHANNPKPSFSEREKLIEGYRIDNEIKLKKQQRVKVITADIVREVGNSETV